MEETGRKVLNLTYYLLQKLLDRFEYDEELDRSDETKKETSTTSQL